MVVNDATLLNKIPGQILTQSADLFLYKTLLSGNKIKYDDYAVCY